MKLVVNKKSVLYGVNGSDAAITNIANIETLKEGSFLIAFDNGVIITAAGTFTGTAGEKSIIYHMLNGELQTSSPIYTGKGAVLEPMADHAPAAKVVTFNILKPESITESMQTGVALFDQGKSIHDPTRRDNITVYTDENTTQADINALEAKILAHDLVATCVLGGATLTITFVADANVDVEGLGEFEKTVAVVTTDISYGDALTYAQMGEFVKTVEPFDGNRDTSIDGTMEMFTRRYGVEMYNYLIYSIEVNKAQYSTGKEDLHRYGANLYIAHAEGDLPAVGKSWLDIFNAAVTGVSLDTDV